MNRPLLLRILPDRLKFYVWSRFYRPQSKMQPLYQNAPLHFAPHISMELVLGDIISDCIAFTGFYDLKLSRRLIRLAHSGGTMIDVGANLGYYSLLWGAVNSKNICFAFEASSRNIDLLIRNVLRNDMADRIRVIPKAVGKSAGSLTFDFGPQDQTGWGGFTLVSGNSTIVIDVVRVDEVIDFDGEISLLKIDIEGADTWALIGCERLLRNRRIKEIWFEQNKPRMRALGIAEGEAEQFLRSVGYDVCPESNPSGEVVQWSASPR